MSNLNRFNRARTALSMLTEYMAHRAERWTGLDVAIVPEAEAIGTHEALVEAFNDPSGTYAVSSTGLEGSIYTSPRVNALARFWHDHTHYVAGEGFTLAGELLTASRQVAELRATGLRLGISEALLDDMCILLWVDVAEQASYYNRTGEFVADQLEFCRKGFEARIN